MADDHDKPDALLDKLDGFLRSGRAHHRRNKPPVLTDALSDDLTQPIPTLTNAIENSSDGDNGTDHEENIKQLVAARLVASVDQEIADLLEAFPDFRDKLALLHRSISFALPQLVTLRWEDADEDAVAAADDAAADSAEDSGSDPDQQT